MKKIFVVGGGASGIISAIRAAENGAQVILFEKMPQIGRKLRITGKGRCNLTNAADIAEIVKNIPGNGKFLFSALKNFSSADTVNFFENLGVKTKIERGGRIFPTSDDANEVIDALLRRLAILNVDVHTNSPVTEILPALVPLETEEDFVKNLQGLSLKNVRVKLLSDGVQIAEQFGEMLFTHFGVSGPIILTLSRQAAKLLVQKKFVELEINLKPALTPEQLDARLLRDFDKFKRKTIKNSLVDLLPSKLIPIILDLSYLPEEKRVDEITLLERRRLVEILRGLPLTITKTRPIEEAIVTAGGVSIKELDPRSMQSKIIDGLYIVGEVADIDGFTGGFNLQSAWSMGNAAGISAAK